MQRSLFSFAVHGKEGKYLCQPTLFTGDGKVKCPKLGDGDPMNAFLTEVKQVKACLDSGKAEGPLDAALAVDALAIADAQSRSLATGKTVKVK